MKRFLSLSLILLALTTSALAQRGRGTILGNVTDASGAVVPGATVTVTNIATNAVATVVTNSDGYFTAPNLLVGAYTVTATKDGFKKALRSGLTLEVDQKAEINLVLETGAVSETIEVSSQASLVDTTTATFGKVIENRRVQELPVNGRNALSLVLLAPAVQSGVGPTASGFADRGTQVSFIRINGSPFATNNLVVDGLSSVNAYLPDVNINPNVDSVQEFKVQTNTMSAEYGFTLGGVVNLVTKSGTNQYHGTVYEFFRNNSLDANSWANNRAARPRQPLRYNQYGGSIGGPVRLPGKVFGPFAYDGRDKSFFFYNYEGYRFITNASGFYTMPTEAFRNGDFSKLADATGKPIIVYDPATTRANPNGNGFLRDPFLNNIIPANRLDAVAKNFLKFYPLPNRPADNAFTNLNNFFGAVGNKRTLTNHTSRFDHRFSERNNFSARYTFYKQFTDNGTGNLYPDPIVRQRTDPFRGHNVVLTDLHNFTPNLIHEFRIGVARQIFDFKVASAGLNIPQQLGLPAIVPPDTIPAIGNGLPGFNTGTVGKRGGSVWQLFDSLTWLRGNHTVKFGTELRLTQANNLQKSSPSGNYQFGTTLTDNAAPIAGNRINTGNAFATFLLGTVSSATVTTHLGESEVGKSYGFYVNDDWKIRRRLSLNLGLRYDYQQQPFERRCGTSMFNPFVTNPLSGLKGATQYACVDYGRTFSKTDGNDFAPRLGFSWDVLGNQKTVVRGGYGIFMSALFSYWNANYESTNGFAGTNTIYQPTNNLITLFQLKDGFPFAPNQPQGARLGPNFFATSSASFKEAISRTPMSQQWNLSLQQQLGGGFLVEVAYSANHGTHLLSGSYDLNQADPALVRQFGLAGQLTNNVANPFAGKVPGAFGGANITQAQALRPFPYVGGITVQAPHAGNSIYHALLVSAEKRFSRGFTLLASYTFAKIISDSIFNGLNFIGSEGGNDFGYQNGLYNRRAERAEDPSNVPHRLVVSGLFELPIGKGKRLDFGNGVANNLLGNWQLNTITTIVQGTPTSVRGANNGLANRPDWIGSLELPGGFTDANPQRGVQWFNPAAFVNPALYVFGNTPRAISQFRNPGAVIVDLSVFKNFTLTEKLKLQFRAEAFNAPNHVNLGTPNTSFGAGPTGTNNNDAFGRITGSRDPRLMQLGLKLIF